MMIMAAALFDFCDGFAARALHAYSAIGKDLDSLADVVSFGVLPGMIMMQVFIAVNPDYHIAVPYLILRHCCRGCPASFLCFRL